MLSDKFGNPVFQEQDIFNMLYKGQLEYLDQIFAEPTEDVIKLFNNLGVDQKQLDPYENLEFFDEANQCEWFIPEEITQFPIVEWLYSQCATEEERERVDEEITAFIEHGMFDLLFCLKYIVDTLRSNNIVWGVGRGSSVSSFVLYLLGVHKINSIKYNLDWQEFLR
jgi:DNA polymerase III alpha subunit